MSTNKKTLIDGDFQVGSSHLIVDTENNYVGFNNATPQNKIDVQIGTRTGTHSTGKPLYVTGVTSTSGAEFVSDDGTAGIGIGSSNIFATETNQNITITPDGTGAVGIKTATPNPSGETFDLWVQGDTKITGNVTVNEIFGDGSGLFNVAGTQWVSSSENIYFLNNTGSGEGKVGIGKTVPEYKLDILDSDKPTIRVKSTSTGDGDALLILDSSATGESDIDFNHDGVLNWRIRTGDAAPSGTTFQLNNANDSDVLTIQQNGNVGIGTNSPNVPLEVNKSAGGEMFRLATSTGTLYAGVDANPPWFGTSSDDHLRLVTNGTEKIRIESGGNVGIGTTSPIRKLDVRSGDGQSASGWISSVFGPATGLTTNPRVVMGTYSNVATIGGHNGDLTAWSDLVINLGGNVGIGKTNPGTALDVNGTVTATTFSGALSGNATSATNADTVDGLHASSFLRSDASDTVNAGVTYTWTATDTHGIAFKNSSYNTFLYLGGWSVTNSDNISRIRNSGGNLHIDSAANGNCYLNWYSAGTVELGRNTNVRGTVTAPTFSATSQIYLGTSASIRQSSTSGWTGDPGSGVGKIEYHSNRWYVVAGSNSSELLRVRQNNSDKFVIDNNGSISLGIVPAARISGTVASASAVTADSTANRFNVYSSSYAKGYDTAALEIREYNLEGATGGTEWERAPRIGFHWGGRVASQIIMDSAGTINIANNPGTAYERLRAGAIEAYGEIYTNTKMRIQYDNPTINFQDTDHLSCFLHNNSNLLYVLRGNNNATTWTQVNGQWPFIFNMSNNDATCGGNFYAVGNVTAYSDIRHKTNIVKIEDSLNKVQKLNGYTYNRKDNGKRFTGLIAQEVQEVLPEAVNEDIKGELSVAYGNMSGLLVEAIKELTAQLKTERERVDVLSKKIGI